MLFAIGWLLHFCVVVDYHCIIVCKKVQVFPNSCGLTVVVPLKEITVELSVKLLIKRIVVTLLLKNGQSVRNLKKKYVVTSMLKYG